MDRCCSRSETLRAVISQMVAANDSVPTVTPPAGKLSGRRHRFGLAALALVLIVVTFGIVLGGRRPRGRTSSLSITVAGSTSVQPFAEMLAEEYAKQYPNRPAVNVQGGGSSAGGRAVLNGAAQIGMLSDSRLSGKRAH